MHVHFNFSKCVLWFFYFNNLTWLPFKKCNPVVSWYVWKSQSYSDDWVCTHTRASCSVVCSSTYVCAHLPPLLYTQITLSKINSNVDSTCIITWLCNIHTMQRHHLTCLHSIYTVGNLANNFGFIFYIQFKKVKIYWLICWAGDFAASYVIRLVHTCKHLHCYIAWL